MSANNAQRTALLVVDVQVGLIDGANPAYNTGEVLANIQNLLQKARASSTPVIYMQHEGDSLAMHSASWQIHPQIAPRKGEVVLSKRASDSFYQTSLEQELAAGASRIWSSSAVGHSIASIRPAGAPPLWVTMSRWSTMRTPP
ncbi:MAG: hypothetical protein NVS4B9_42180 [Ktedonobacteraceae bacterium]